MKYFPAVLFILIINSDILAQNTFIGTKPVFTSQFSNRVQCNVLYIYQIQAMDSASNPLSYIIKERPTWLHYDSTHHTLTGKTLKAGQYSVEIEVSNLHSISRQKFMLTVYDNKTKNILCLGNSITNGTGKYNSYRRHLWQMLHQAHYNFDFIGSWNKHHMGLDVPDADFDMDHDGHSGWSLTDFFNPPSWDSKRGSIHDWLKLYSPDIVLVELGTNDVFQCRSIGDMLTNFQDLIRTLRQKNNRVKIFVAQIPPLGKQWAKQKLCGNEKDYDQAILELNKSIDSFPKTLSLNESPVIVVNLYTGINTDTELYDDIHPNEAGEKKMAERWYAVIHGYLNKLKQ